jgi:hypothetical protein
MVMLITDKGDTASEGGNAYGKTLFTGSICKVHFFMV